MSHDLLIAGAGLSGALIALAVRDARPDARIALVDAAPGPSDGHTWSCHDPDLSPAWHARLAPARRAAWPRQEVRFPARERVLTTGYSSIGGRGLAGLLTGMDLRWSSPVAALDDGGATLSCGTRIDAPCVIDARGAQPSPHLTVGFQKFVGVEIETDAPHGVPHPMIMDATVPQLDGYRFIYLLPFGPTRILIEDTRYSDGAGLDDDALAQASLDYAATRGWQGREVRRERGVLPIALAHDARAFWTDHAKGPVPVGLRAGLFHPVTGYSLPMAAQVADAIAARDLTTASARRAVRGLAIDRADRDRFPRLLNRMLFRGCAPDRRYRLLQRFYGLPQPLIERFYAGRLTWADRARIVSGRPPIGLARALRCLPERPLLQENA